MRSLPWIFALSAVLAFTTGCARKNAGAGASANSAAPANGPIKIGFLVKQPEEPWFQYEQKAATKTGEKLGFSVINLGTQDGEKVMAAIDNIAVDGAQGFIICTPDVQLGPSIMNKAKQKGLKVVTIDDQFLWNGKFMTDVPYVGMSASQIGQSVGENLYAEMKKRGWNPNDTAACVITFEELDTARERTDHAISALTAAGFPAAKIYKAPQKTTDIPGSFDAASVLFTQHPEVKHWLIAGMNDNAVLGAVRASENRGFNADNVIGIGINGTDCIDELRKPKATGFYGSMFVSAPQEGRTAAEILYHWIKDGTQPPLDTRTKAVLITRENFQDVLHKEGIL
jgi:L-arabinose transport system substrate-binding protein